MSEMLVLEWYCPETGEIVVPVGKDWDDWLADMVRNDFVVYDEVFEGKRTLRVDYPKSSYFDRFFLMWSLFPDVSIESFPKIGTV